MKNTTKMNEAVGMNNCIMVGGEGKRLVFSFKMQ